MGLAIASPSGAGPTASPTPASASWRRRLHTGRRGSGADTLALRDETGPAVPVALFAAAWAGMSYAPLNFKFQPDYVRQLLDRLGDTLVVYGRQYHAALAGAGEVAVEEAESWLDDLGNGDSGG